MCETLWTDLRLQVLELTGWFDDSAPAKQLKQATLFPGRCVSVCLWNVAKDATSTMTQYTMHERPWTSAHKLGL